MHGLGMVGDLLILGFYMAGSVIWLCFWVLCIVHRHILFGQMTDLKSMALVAACICTIAIGLYLAAIETFSRDHEDWLLVVAATLIPVIGIQIIRQRIR